VSVSDYLREGQDVSFQIENPEVSPKFISIVEDINNQQFTIRVLDENFKLTDISSNSDVVVYGTKAGLEYTLKVKIEKIDNNLITLKYIPSRSHLRVNSYVILNYRIISGEEFIEQKNKYIQNISHDTEENLYKSQIFTAEELDLTTEHPSVEILNEIKTLNKKIDFIINHLIKPDDKSILDEEQTEVSLSGSGIKFISSDNLKTGDFLEMKLVLPLSTGIVIDFIAEVIRVIKPAGSLGTNDPESSEIAVKYVAINGDDREMIIRYTFKRQRELLRASEGSSD
jgi:c-di-GMP-binding flagellar brake protein YcgR